MCEEDLSTRNTMLPSPPQLRQHGPNPCLPIEQECIGVIHLTTSPKEGLTASFGFEIYTVAPGTGEVKQLEPNNRSMSKHDDSFRGFLEQPSIQMRCMVRATSTATRRAYSRSRDCKYSSSFACLYIIIPYQDARPKTSSGSRNSAWVSAVVKASSGQK